MKTLIFRETQEEFEALNEEQQTELISLMIWNQLWYDDFLPIVDEWNMGFITMNERNNQIIDFATKKEKGLNFQFAFRTESGFMPTAPLKPAPTTSVERLQEYMDHDGISEEKAELIMELINNHFENGIPRPMMKKIGFSVYDTDKPYVYMKSVLVEFERLNIPIQWLNGTVWDYTNNKLFGKIESAHLQLFRHIIKTLGE